MIPRMRIARNHGLALALAGALGLLGCGSGSGDGDDAGNGGNGDDGGGQPLPDGAVAPMCDNPSSSTDLTLVEVVRGLSQPIFVTSPPNDPRLFVVEQAGVIKIVEGNEVTGTFLDIRTPVTSGGERGLLGLAFHPNYPADGRFFLNYSAANLSGATVIAEYRVSSDPAVADASSEVRLLEISQPRSNHNGGMIAFGADGYLYIGMGDSGGGGDPDNDAQNPSTLLGSMLRIDVSTAGEYAIPTDNPFVAGGGAPEVWAYGLRNPWRFSFDRQTGDLYIGDVGQNAVEEISFLPAGAPGGTDFGWRICEGSSGPNCGGQGRTAPISEYGHMAAGCQAFGTTASVTGGYVYRGSCLTSFQGHYFFGDWCHDMVWHFPADAPTNSPPELSLSGLNGLASFGEDAAGELYLVSRNNGRLYRLAAAE
jgi:glucose/arabinose dehydrogenase